MRTTLQKETPHNTNYNKNEHDRLVKKLVDDFKTIEPNANRSTLVELFMRLQLFTIDDLKLLANERN